MKSRYVNNELKMTWIAHLPGMRAKELADNVGFSVGA
ncbi:MAG: hypothetical protein HW390_2165 [Candidatus Brocadiaceae bacterium]|nr:hypothetical protein [Candidatus Brocadiaceae bacterium]